jgi:transposase
MRKIEIDDTELVQLELALKRAKDPRQLQRAQALIWLSKGDTVSEIADRLHVDRHTIYNWISRYSSKNGNDPDSALVDAKRSGRPPTAKGIIDPIIDLVIDSDPADYGYNSSVWMASLLQQYLSEEHHLSISRKSVSRAIDRLEFSWQHPRYRLSRRDPHWRQSKGGSKTASGRAREQRS